MPEGPEVAFTRLVLARHVAGRRVREVVLADPAVIRTHLSTSPRDAHPDAEALAKTWVGAPVQAPVSHGKRLGIGLGRAALLMHLGMSGRWIRRDAPPRHGRLGLHLSDGAWWWFEDQRRFGGLAPVSRPLAQAVREGLGPEVSELDGKGFVERLSPRRALKGQLMDQTVVAGLGNIQVTEALWRAGLHPRTRPARVQRQPLLGLRDHLVEVALETLGHLERDGELIFVSQDPSRSPFRIYGRAGSPCPACGTLLVDERIGGRAATLCPRCQPDPSPIP